MTSRLSGVRSNHLSYRPGIRPDALHQRTTLRDRPTTVNGTRPAVNAV